MPQTTLSAAPLNTSLSKVQIMGLGCRRGQRTLFRNLSLELSPGEALVLSGPNGAGKTSFLRIMAGLLGASAGTIHIHAGDEIHSSDMGALAQLSCFIGVHDALKSGLTPRETLQFHCQITGGKAATTVDAALNGFGLSAMADMPNGWLSSGQRKRVALSALALCPLSRPLWLLDEPVNALDVQACGQLGTVIARHRAQGGIVIAATHQLLNWPDIRELPLGETA